jgi:hypothetical protein
MGGPSPAVGNEKATPASLKKRTAAQAGLDNAVVPAPGAQGKGAAREIKMAMGDAKEMSDPVKKNPSDGSEALSGKEWLIEQVAKMESAFKVCIPCRFRIYDFDRVLLPLSLSRMLAFIEL